LIRPVGQDTVLPFPVPRRSATVKPVEATNEPDVALTVVCPGAMLIANPEALILATAMDEELQVTVLVKSCVVPIAVNCRSDPGRRELFNGAMLTETRGSWIIRVVEPVRGPRAAEIAEVPCPTPVAVPCDPDVLLMVATLAGEEAQFVFVVMFAAVPSV